MDKRFENAIKKMESLSDKATDLQGHVSDQFAKVQKDQKTIDGKFVEINKEVEKALNSFEKEAEKNLKNLNDILEKLKSDADNSYDSISEAVQKVQDEYSDRVGKLIKSIEDKSKEILKIYDELNNIKKQLKIEHGLTTHLTKNTNSNYFGTGYLYRSEMNNLVNTDSVTFSYDDKGNTIKRLTYYQPDDCSYGGYATTDSIFNSQGQLIVDFDTNSPSNLKLYLNSYRNYGCFHEDCTIQIAKELEELLQPKWLRIGGYWYPRGGIPIDIFYQSGDIPKGIWIPEPGVAPYTGRK